MSCNRSIHAINQQLTHVGGSAVTSAPPPMITYKHLILSKRGQFVSPVSRKTWKDMQISATGEREEEKSDWIWSCTSPSHPALLSYQSEETVLVTLEVWGKVVVDETGIVRSQYARIIGYDATDYYYLLWQRRKIPTEVFKNMISPDSWRVHNLIISNPELFDEKLAQEALEKKPTPEFAFYIAKHGLVRNEKTREIACQNPYYAFKYALEVDGYPSEETRAAACHSSYAALAYAEKVDKCPRDDTRAAACMEPDHAFFYALNVDKSPRDDTRNAVLSDPQYAYEYALKIDQSPRDDTRLAACRNAAYARLYAQYVDKCPRDETRKAACKKPISAYIYALEVDKGYHPDTWKAVQKSSRFRKLYAQDIAGTPIQKNEG